MGIAKGGAILLMKEALRRPFSGKILTLGRQDITVSHYQLKHYAKISGFSRSLPPVHGDPYEHLKDSEFFSFLGFEKSSSLDYSNFEGASIPFDLNSGETPEMYRGAFDVIYDGGTLEHIFHLPNAFKSLISMLKVNGRLIHLNPASNHLEHSFYMFSPTFFYDYYFSNKFAVNYIQLVRYSPSQDHEWVTYDYQPGCFEGTSIGSGLLDKAMYAVHTIVTKTEQSTSHVIPNQGMYARDMWVQPRSRDQSSVLQLLLKEKTLRKWKQRIKLSPLYPIYAYWKLKIRKHGIPLKPSSRF